MTHFDAEARSQRAKERLGTNYLMCLLCGHRGDKWEFDVHHIAGIHFDKQFVFRICATCHRKISHRQNDLPIASSKSPPLVERSAHVCIGIALLAEPIAEMVDVWRQQLAAFARKRRAKDDSLPMLITHCLEWIAAFLRSISMALRTHGLELLTECNSTTG
jgi:hypothetical protein